MITWSCHVTEPLFNWPEVEYYFNPKYYVIPAKKKEFDTLLLHLHTRGWYLALWIKNEIHINNYS